MTQLNSAAKTKKMKIKHEKTSVVHFLPSRTADLDLRVVREVVRESFVFVESGRAWGR